MCVCIQGKKCLRLPHSPWCTLLSTSLNNTIEPVCAAALRPLGFWSSCRRWMRIANVYRNVIYPLVWVARGGSVFLSGVSSVLWCCWQPSQSSSYPSPPSFNSTHHASCVCLSFQFSSYLLLLGGTGRFPVWVALFFPTRLPVPPLKISTNLVVRRE